jgi:hypothetical protein
MQHHAPTAGWQAPVKARVQCAASASRDRRATRISPRAALVEYSGLSTSGRELRRLATVASNRTAGNRGDTVFESHRFALAIRGPMQRREPGWVLPAWPARATSTRGAG